MAGISEPLNCWLCENPVEEDVPQLSRKKLEVLSKLCFVHMNKKVHILSDRHYVLCGACIDYAMFFLAQCKRAYQGEEEGETSLIRRADWFLASMVLTEPGEKRLCLPELEELEKIANEVASAKETKTNCMCQSDCPDELQSVLAEDCIEIHMPCYICKEAILGVEEMIQHECFKFCNHNNEEKRLRGA
ncbi:Hypothetical predicted protein [Cloeon dipterum]|uniref:Uncharacterized protein n=1 Tax=Cloeon dipterum TaxID=197152 RepID=A0A8S1CHA8_9INSE|nr:Hypothetical predicted protein [Cloeon dipterum]